MRRVVDPLTRFRPSAQSLELAFQMRSSYTVAEVWSLLPNAARVWLTALDVALNVRWGPRQGETLSERAVRDKLAGGWMGREVCLVLERADPGHCARIIEQMERERIALEFLKAVTGTGKGDSKV